MRYCGILALPCAVLRYSYPPYAPLPKFSETHVFRGTIRHPYKTVGWIAEYTKQRYKTIMIAIVQHLFLQRVLRSSSRSTFICFTRQVHQHENVIFQLTFWYYEEVTFPKDRFPRVLSRCFPDFLAVWNGGHLSRRVGFVQNWSGFCSY